MGFLLSSFVGHGSLPSAIPFRRHGRHVPRPGLPEPPGHFLIRERELLQPLVHLRVRRTYCRPTGDVLRSSGDGLTPHPLPRGLLRRGPLLGGCVVTLVPLEDIVASFDEDTQQFAQARASVQGRGRDPLPAGAVRPGRPQRRRLLGWRQWERARAHRAELARLCRRFVVERSDPRCRAYAVNREALKRYVQLLAELWRRLEDSNRPVTPQGMILVGHVLCDGAGPLFNPARADELGPMLAAALRARYEGEQSD